MSLMPRLIPLLLASLLVASAVPVAAHEGTNHGTIKVHDDATATPGPNNEPKVTCDFFIEGFNMAGQTGHLVFESIPPSSNPPVEVTPVGDTSFNGTPEADGDGFHFVAGPFRLEPGHYKVYAFLDIGHPGNEEHSANSKVFKVDACEEGEIPFFPSAIAGAAALAGCVGAYAVYRRKQD